MATAPNLVPAGFENGFIPELSGEVIAFARSEKDWKINKYCQYVPSPQPFGVFTVLGRDEFVSNRGGSIAPSDIAGGGGSASKAWHPGDDIPYGEQNQILFLEQEYRCSFRNEAWRLATDTLKTFKFFNLRQANIKAATTRLLTDRVNRAVGQLTNASNWGTHTNPATTLNNGAGPWSTGSDDPNSAAYLALFKSLQKAARAIHLDSNGVVTQDKLITVIGPDLAIALSESAEMVNYCRETPQAVQLTKEGFDPQWELWGIPSTYRGYRLLVEDAPIVTGNVGPNLAAGGVYPNQPQMAAESSTRAYIWPASTAVMMARVGGLDGEFGGPSYSTFQIFHWGGLLQSYAFEQPEHFRTIGLMRECIDLRIVANLTGYCITGCI